jgi:uncharacterized protein YkwD
MRVLIVSVCVAAMMGGCSVGTIPLSGGFTPDSELPTKSRKSGATKVATSGEESVDVDSSATAPAGALDDRDYTTARLDPAKALEAINGYRREKGLKTVSLDPKLTLAAKAHSRDLAKHDRISHYGSDGSSPWDRVKRTGYSARLAAENVGTGQASFEEVMQGWKESDGHNKNLLLPDARHMGVALVQDPNTEFKTFWTLVVGSPM